MGAYLTIGGIGLTAAVIFTAFLGAGRLSGLPDGVDPIVLATIPTNVPAPSQAFAPSTQFSISNRQAHTACLAERGQALTSRSRDFAPGADCAAVWPGLSIARNWTQNEDGSVTLSTGHGDVVVTLVEGTHGFAYESADVTDGALTWLLIP